MNGKKWTDTEIEKLIEWLPRYPVATIALMMKRSKRSIYSQIVVRGLQYETQYHLRADERCGVVAKLRKLGKPYSYIASVIGTSKTHAARIGQSVMK